MHKATLNKAFLNQQSLSDVNENKVANNHQKTIVQENVVYNTLPPDIVATLDNISYKLALKEDKSAMEIKNNLVKNLEKLNLTQINYLLTNLNELIYKSTHLDEDINDKNVDIEFINFLMRLYY